MSERPVPLLTDMTPAARAVALAYYEAGVVTGVQMGRQQAEDEHRGLSEVSAAIARQVADLGPFADLCDRRGEPERAARQRALLAARGVTA